MVQPLRGVEDGDIGQLEALEAERPPASLPGEGKLGVIAEGTYADLTLVDGDPLKDLDLVADPDKNFVVIMKDGKIYKHTLGQFGQ